MDMPPAGGEKLTDEQARKWAESVFPNNEYAAELYTRRLLKEKLTSKEEEQLENLIKVKDLRESLSEAESDPAGEDMGEFEAIGDYESGQQY